MSANRRQPYQIFLAAGVVLLALGLGVGALGISSDAGYAGVGPNFLPWLVAVALLLCGVFMVYEACTGGFRDTEEAQGEDQPCWRGFLWMSAGLLVNAALITTIGFILSCTLCFVMAVRGMRHAQGGAQQGLNSWVKDGITGLLIAAPVYWFFNQFLAINLPGLTQTGWL